MTVWYPHGVDFTDMSHCDHTQPHPPTACLARVPREVDEEVVALASSEYSSNEASIEDCFPMSRFWLDSLLGGGGGGGEFTRASCVSKLNLRIGAPAEDVGTMGLGFGGGILLTGLT